MFIMSILSDPSAGMSATVLVCLVLEFPQEQLELALLVPVLANGTQVAVDHVLGCAQPDGRRDRLVSGHRRNRGSREWGCLLDDPYRCGFRLLLEELSLREVAVASAV